MAEMSATQTYSGRNSGLLGRLGRFPLFAAMSALAFGVAAHLRMGGDRGGCRKGNIERRNRAILVGGDTTVVSDASLPPPLPEEPLALSAPLARAWAKTLCRHVNESGISCAVYHGLWQDLRRLGLAAGPRRGAQFFLDAFHDAVRAGGRRILVSGAVDYCLPAIVLWAATAAGAKPDLTVIDICETPLRLCAWYGDRIGVEIGTVRSDILDYEPAAPYDIVVAHSLLSEIPPAARGRLIAKWRDCLVPGGRVIGVNRVRPDAPEVLWFTAEQTKEFHELLLREATLHAAELDIAPEELAASTDSYVAYRLVYPLRSREVLSALFEDNGFRVASLTADVPDPRYPGNSQGPTLAGGPVHLKFVAIRQ